jgi:hypothetical protein
VEIGWGRREGERGNYAYKYAEKQKKPIKKHTFTQKSYEQSDLYAL